MRRDALIKTSCVSPTRQLNNLNSFARNLRLRCVILAVDAGPLTATTPAAGPVVGILIGRASGMDLPVMLPTMQRTMNVPTEMDRPMMRRVSLT